MEQKNNISVYDKITLSIEVAYIIIYNIIITSHYYAMISTLGWDEFVNPTLTLNGINGPEDIGWRIESFFMYEQNYFIIVGVLLFILLFLFSQIMNYKKKLFNSKSLIINLVIFSLVLFILTYNYNTFYTDIHIDYQLLFNNLKDIILPFLPNI